MNTAKLGTKTGPAAYSLIEVLVYISVLAVLMGVGYAAVYRAMDNSVALRRNAQDIAAALRAGEIWRADVRAAVGRVQVERNADGQILHLSGPQKKVDYRFEGSALARRVGGGNWSPVLGNVKGSEFLKESHSGVQSWRWELELQPRKKKLNSIQPLFTFTAVPGSNAAK